MMKNCMTNLALAMIIGVFDTATCGPKTEAGLGDREAREHARRYTGLFGKSGS